MRTIKFRGKRLDNGEWIEGNLIIKHKPTEVENVFWGVLIHDGALSAHEVDPATVGQFTGLVDKNGREIWEGDKLRALQGEQMKDDSFYEINGIVIFSNGSFECFSKPLSKINGNGKILWCYHGHLNTPDIYEEIRGIEVIGNIHDKAEMI